MQPRRTGAGREDVDPLEGEEWARVLEHSGSGVILAVSENKLHLIRLRERPGVEKQIIGSRVYFGSDVNQREAIAEPLGMTRYRDLSNMSKGNLSVVIAEIIAEGKQLALGSKAKKKTKDCRDYLDKKMEQSDAPIYGINTGFGALCNHKITNKDLGTLQKNLR